MMTERRCDECRFWQYTDTIQSFLVSITQGECRIRSPRVLQSGTNIVTAWPVIEANMWCGEWRAEDP